MSTASLAATPPALSRTHGWILALTATLTMAVSYVDRQALAALAPTVTKAFGISETQYGLLLSAFSFAYLIGSPPAGALVDRIGARRGLFGAVLTWSLVAAAHAIIPGFGVLLGLRIALGLAEAPSFPGAAQIVERALPPLDRPRGFGILFTGSSLGAIVAPILATSLEKRWGFRVAFLGTAAIGLAWVPIWLALTSGPRVRAALDGARTEAKEKPSLREAITHPAVLRGALAVSASAPAMGLLVNWGAKFLVAEHGLAQKDVGPYIAIPPLLFDVGAILFGHLASVRARSRTNDDADRPLFAAATLLALCIGATPYGRTPLESMVIGGIGMAGGGGTFALFTADMLARVPSRIVSTASGLCGAAQSVAFIIASPLLGKLIEVSGGYRAPFLAIAAWIVPGCVAWLVWKPPPFRDRAPA